MPRYDFRAYNASGKTYHSFIESSNLSEAKTKLFDQGVVFVSIKENRKKKSNKIKAQTLFYFTEQLADLLNADLPLYESLLLLIDQLRQDPFFLIADQIAESLKKGLSFSEALKKFPKCFDSFYCTMVEMGEQSGHLQIALKKIAIELARRLKIQKQLISALLYPSFLMGFCFILIGILIFYIIPSIESFLDLSAVGSLTKTVITTCHHLKDYGAIYLTLLLSACAILRLSFYFNRYQTLWDKQLLRLPLIRTCFIEMFVARWSATLSLLLSGGVALLDALNLAEHVLTNQVIKDKLHTCTQNIKEGMLLSRELKKITYIPPLVVQMVTIGENSGDLALSFDRLAKIFEDRVDKRLSRFMTLLAPISLIIMAAFIGLIMVSVLIPLTDINSFSF